jgi:hypothetical protein
VDEDRPITGDSDDRREIGDGGAGGTEGPEPTFENGGPEINWIEPSAAAPGAEIVITGMGFGSQGTRSSIHLKPNAPDLGGAYAQVLSWRHDTVRARVPDMAALGSGGLTWVTLTTSMLGTFAAPITVLETSPPAITSLSRSAGVATEELRIYGQRFGVDGTEDRAVLFRATDQSPGVPATITWWRRNEVRVAIPDPSALGGPGVKRVSVQTPWGTSPAVNFTVAERPVVTGVNPIAAPPDGLVTVSGRAFGTSAANGVVLRDPTWGPQSDVPMEVAAWSPTEIKAYVPGLPALGVTGDKQLVVRSDVGASAPAPFRVLEIGSITAWTRIEPRSRTEDPEEVLRAGLRAEIADPLWLLGRQWVLGELQATDGGSPVLATFQGESVPLARWRPGRSGVPRDIPRGAGAPPLEAVVEREAVFPPLGATTPFADRRLAVEAGQQFLRFLATRVLDATRAAAYRRGFIDAYPMARPSAAERATLDDASRRFLDVVAARAADGALLYQVLRPALPADQGGRSELPARPAVDPTDRAAVLAAVADWFGWCRQLVTQPADGEVAWERDRMEYAFSVSFETAGGEVVLSAPEYTEGRLDWHAFVRRAGDSLRASGAPPPTTRLTVGRSVVPSPVSYPGMPAPRWWEMEDARIDFGGIEAGPSDLLRMLFVEFATVYGNDWFLLPVDGVPVGSLLTLSSVQVTDTFGGQTVLPPFTRSGVGGVWAMFQVSATDGSRAANLLLLPPSVTTTLESPPVEDVLFLRDEMANMAWAVERTVASPSGRPLDRHEAYQAERARREQAGGPAPAPRPPGVPDIAYRLSTEVPPQWIPLVPIGQGASRRLLRSAMLRHRTDGVTETVPPAGRILEPGVRLELFDEEVPREGARVVRTWQMARSEDGSTHLWVGRRKDAGRGEGSSGLRFDVLVPNPPPLVTPPAPTSPPVVSGLAQIGQTLTATAGTWSGTQPLAFAYEWRRVTPDGRSSVDIQGGTARQYPVVAADEGFTLRVVVTATNEVGSATAASARTAVVGPVPVPPVNTRAPAVVGEPYVGSVLSADPGRWSGAPAPTLTYQWLRSPAAGEPAAAIPGATEPTYVPQGGDAVVSARAVPIGESDVGSVLLVRITATNSAGSATATSPPTPTITERARPPAEEA